MPEILWHIQFLKTSAEKNDLPVRILRDHPVKEDLTEYSRECTDLPMNTDSILMSMGIILTLMEDIQISTDSILTSTGTIHLRLSAHKEAERLLSREVMEDHLRTDRLRADRLRIYKLKVSLLRAGAVHAFRDRGREGILPEDQLRINSRKDLRIREHIRQLRL